MSQNPSPMVDSTRAHGRIEERIYPGKHHIADDILPRPVEIYIPEKLDYVAEYGLLIHFHGAAYIAQNAVHAAKDPYITAVVNLGTGSAVYEKGFADGDAFPKLLDQVKETVSPHLGTTSCSRVYLSAFSAGYGAAGKILDGAADRVDGLILLETNTQPGMTPTSLTPEQAAHVGISFPELCAWIVEDASCGR